MNNVSFQGRTNILLSPDAYDTVSRVTNATYRHLTPGNRCNLTNGKVFTSSADTENLLVLVRNENTGFLKHVPINEKIQKFVDEIALRIEDMKAGANEKLTAWIIGGNDYVHDNGKTITALNKLAEVMCDKPDIDTSILTGMEKAREDIVIHTRKGITELTFAKKPDADLENHFNIVELNNIEYMQSPEVKEKAAQFVDVKI